MEPNVNIVLHTNLDKYDMSHFPNMNNFKQIPRVGEYIWVKSSLIKHYQNQKLPGGLEVVKVEYKEIEPTGTWDQKRYEVLVELWYKPTEFELYNQSGHKLL